MRRCLVVLSSLACAAAGAQTAVTIEVDAAQPQSALRDLRGVNKPPRFGSRTPGVNYDATALYKAFGITQARLHDGGADLCSVYKAATKLNMSTSPATTVTGCTLTGSGGIPQFRWTPTSSADADLNNPDNYDFATLDESITTTLAAGGRVYLVLDQSYNGPNDTGDPVAWAKVATNIYRHVIGVFKPSAGVAVDPVYVEVMNEPDGGFWRGDLATFNTLYIETTQRVRAAAAAAGRTVKVGGAGFTRDVLNKATTAGNPANGFVGNVGAGNLDFFSAHWYDKCNAATMPASAAYLRSLRALVNSQGGGGKPMQVTEWNVGLGNQCGNDFFAGQRTQSFAGGLLTLMQDPAQAIEAAHFYAGVTVMSLFDYSTAEGYARINPSAWAFWAHAKLAGATGVSAQVCAQGSACVAGYAADGAPLLALAGSAGASGKLTTVVTNDGTSAASYTLKFKGLAGSTAAALVRDPPQGTQDLALAGSPAAPSAAAVASLVGSVPATERTGLAVSAGQTSLSLTVPARSVQLVELWPGSAGVPVSNAQADCLFAWGEANYASLLQPAGASSQVSLPYYYRYYKTTNTYLGISSADQRLYYLPASQTSVLQDLGPAMTWVIKAGCV